MFQSPSLFAGSIRNGIALCRPSASLDDIRSAARVAVDADIAAMPMGYDTVRA